MASGTVPRRSRRQLYGVFYKSGEGAQQAEGAQVPVQAREQGGGSVISLCRQAAGERREGVHKLTSGLCSTHGSSQRSSSHQCHWQLGQLRFLAAVGCGWLTKSLAELLSIACWRACSTGGVQQHVLASGACGRGQCQQWSWGSAGPASAPVKGQVTVHNRVS